MLNANGAATQTMYNWMQQQATITGCAGGDMKMHHQHNEPEAQTGGFGRHS